MKVRPLTLSLMLGSAVLIGAAIYYIGSDEPGISFAPVAVAVAPGNSAVTEGALEIVSSAPKPFGGRLSDQAYSADAYSSNPPRDPAEDEVIKISAQYQTPDNVKVEQLLSLIPRLPEDTKVLAIENAAAMIKDEDYLGYRARLLQLSQSPEMRETVMNDALTRGEEVRLPTLVDMLGSTKSEAENTEIREILEAYLDKDYGPNPLNWVAPIKKWVAENSDE